MRRVCLVAYEAAAAVHKDGTMSAEAMPLGQRRPYQRPKETQRDSKRAMRDGATSGFERSNSQLEKA